MDKKTIIEKFDLYKNNEQRNLFIKEGREFKTSKKKIIFLLHDAQNFFEKEYATIKISWELEKALEKLNIKNYLAFGVQCLPWHSRIIEFSPFELRLELQKDVNYKKLPSIKPGADKYLEACFKNLVPYTEKKFDFNFQNATTIMIGSSMGALLTTYFAKKNPDLLSGYIAFSNCFYANYPQVFDFLSQKGPLKNYYHYMGGKENSGNISSVKEYINSYEWLEKWLNENNIDHGSSFYPEGKHSEIAWAKELPKAIEWVLKNSSKIKNKE